MEAVMIRYGELFLKSEPVKRRFIAGLMRNINHALDAYSLEHRIELHRGRMLISGEDAGKIADVVSRVFGVVGVSVCTITTPDIEGMAEAAAARARQHLTPGMTFAVRARRTGVEGFTSQELGGMVGYAIGNRFPEARVDLSHPDYEVFVEARDFGGIVYDREQAGPGGLPAGTQGTVMALLSEGIDSPVASWLMMRRGCELIHIHMSGGRFSGKDVFDAVLRHHAELSRWCMGFPLDLLVVDIEPYYARMMEDREQRYRCVLCKRFMHMAASALVRQYNAYALVNGDNLGQVASQTLANMSVISSAAAVPLLRPLIGFDKTEIVERARMIGTFDTVKGDVGCRMAPRYPSTAAPGETIERLEVQMKTEEMVREAVGSVRRYRALNGEITGIS